MRLATSHTSPPLPPSPPLGPPNATGPSRRNDTQPAPPSPPRTFSWASSTNPLIGSSRLRRHTHGDDHGYPRAMAGTHEYESDARPRTEVWAGTMAGVAHRRRRGARPPRCPPAGGGAGAASSDGPRGDRGRAARQRGDAGGRRRASGRSRSSPIRVAHLLRARPRPHPARRRLSPAGGQDAGVRVPRRSSAHAPHPRARGRAGGHLRSPVPLGLNVALTEAIALGHDCGHGPGGHASEDALDAVRRRAATTTPSGAPTWCSRRSTCASRRSTASATTRGRCRRPARRRARWSAGPIASPTSATTSRTRCTPASSTSPTMPHDGARRVRRYRRQQLGAFIGAVVDCRRPRRRSGWTAASAEALAAFRRFNYERHLHATRVGRPGRRRHQGAARAGRALRRQPALPVPDAGCAATTRMRARGHLRGRHDRSVRLSSTAIALLDWPARPAAAKASTALAASEPDAVSPTRQPMGSTSTTLRPLRVAELHRAVDEREQRVVATDADVLAGVELGATLAHDDRAGVDLACRRTPSRRGAGRWNRGRCGLNRHLWSSTWRSALLDRGDLDDVVLLTVPVATTLVGAALVGEAVDLRALGPADDLGR